VNRKGAKRAKKSARECSVFSLVSGFAAIGSSRFNIVPRGSEFGVKIAKENRYQKLTRHFAGLVHVNEPVE